MPPLVATVIKTSRRWVVLLDAEGVQIQARSSTKALEVTVGDRVRYSEEDCDLVIQEILPRRNQLERKNETRSKIFAANVDHLYIVSSVGSLFNTAFIDRALISASDQDIPATLIINKSDLSNTLPDEADCYQKLGVQLLMTSTKTEAGITELKQLLNQPRDHLVVFCGLSGVGKSSLLNVLIPGSKRDVGDLSHRRTIGKQTTTQAEAFPYLREPLDVLHIVDLPGFSQFGMIHVQLNRLAQAFPEFAEAASQCEFTNCAHRDEVQCGIKQKVASGEIASFRYQSYLEIRHEIECARSY